jgi:branched-subunit amino acid aminotransferase/4-amino-4-deoxychorismate lyase
MPVVESHARREVLDGAEAVFLTNSLIGVRTVAMIDDRPIGGEDLVSELREAAT